MSFVLTTKERVKTRLGITVTSFDTLLDRLILSTTARIEKMCNRHFMQAEYNNELYDGSDVYGSRRCALMVKNAPLLTIESVEYKAGSNSDPDWTVYDEDDYDVDMEAGILYFSTPLPHGKRNVRISYTGGFSGYDIGIDTHWVFNETPTGTVDSSNLTFTLPEDAEELVVYADGLRISSSNYSFTADTDSFTFNVGQQPYSTVSVDYKPSVSVSDDEDPTLPLEVVELCEEVVIRLFKRRDSEGKSSESFGESQVTWREDVFTKENVATIKNYRRSSFL
jgi:hypothetical protein